MSGGPIRIAVDVASGDFGAPVVIAGVLEARRRWQGQFRAVLCGDRRVLERELATQGLSDTGAEITIEHCPESVGPDDIPSQAWRKRRGSSVVRCVSLQREGAVDATVSAGDTAVLMASAVFLLGRRRGVARPALAASMPTSAGKPVLVLDVGANVDCRPEHLVSFAQLGLAYAQRQFELKQPRVALLSVGSEQGKGSKTVNAVHAALRRKCREYVGYVEGSRVLSGDCDVVVCDGFAGNVLLKVCDSLFELVESVLATDPALLESARRRMAVLSAESYGAVPLLGIHGVVFKAHGNSSARAIASAVGTTITAVKRGALAEC